ncbi:hypothetical protein STEG23_022145 [Scotinomys teguina]
MAVSSLGIVIEKGRIGDKMQSCDSVSLLAASGVQSGEHTGERKKEILEKLRHGSAVNYLGKVVIQIQLYTKLALELEWVLSCSKPQHIAKRKGNIISFCDIEA